MRRATRARVRALGFLALIGCDAAAGISVDAGDASVSADRHRTAPAVTAPALLLDGTALDPRAVQLWTCNGLSPQIWQLR
jgi:hypothetical protein